MHQFTSDKDGATDSPLPRRPFVELLLEWIRPQESKLHVYMHKNSAQFGRIRRFCTNYLSPTNWMWYFVESILSWIVIIWFSCCYLIDYCLLVLHMRYRVEPHRMRWCYSVPLTTMARTKAKMETRTLQRYQHLQKLLKQSYLAQQKQRGQPLRNGNGAASEQTVIGDDNAVYPDEFVVQALRSHQLKRYLASAIMEAHGRGAFPSTTGKDGEFLDIDKINKVLKQLERIWPAVLELPPVLLPPSSLPRSRQMQQQQPISSSSSTPLKSATTSIPAATGSDHYEYDISLVLPVYKEQPDHVETILLHALEKCHAPAKVQVIIVNAGGSPGLDAMISNFATARTNLAGGKCWGELQLVHYLSGGGRGSTLNYGALHGHGTVLTFLHSDTLLPSKWDTLVQDALRIKNHPSQPVTLDNCNGHDTNSTPGKMPSKVDDASQVHPSDVIPHACAFSMGINTKPYQYVRQSNGTNLRQQQPSSTYLPPGIGGVAWFLGWIRCHLCQMPYGDSAISMPASYFHHIGGYPDQPLMEDYELVALLRKRSLLLKNKESMVMIPTPALCSPRRWQRYGVCYTLLVNAACVYRYKHGATAEDLFQFYYRQR